MRVIVFLCLLVLTIFVSSKIAPGVVEQIYSTQGLIDHYKSLFKHSGHTFDSSDMGSESETWGWWIFGTKMSIRNTYLDEYKFGSLGKVNLVDNTYDFEIGPMTGKLKYTWTWRFFVIPFNYKAECKFSIGTHHLKQKFEIVNEKLQISRSIDYTGGPPKLDCSGNDRSIMTNSHYDWMTEVRAKYEKSLGKFFTAAMDDWLNSVDTIFPKTSEANLDDLTYSLSAHVKQAEPDQQTNLMVGYNYDISLLKKKRSPVATEEMGNMESKGDLTTYFYEEYFQSLVELDQEAVDFWAAVNSENLPKGSSYKMIAKDFRYIIDGMQNFDASTPITVGCEYGSPDIQARFDETTGVNLVLPLLCSLRAGNTKALDIFFEYKVMGTPKIDSDGSISITDVSYDIDNFTTTNRIGGRVIDDYLINRIIEYSELVNPLAEMKYNDERFKGMNQLSVEVGKQYLKVYANIPD